MLTDTETYPWVCCQLSVGRIQIRHPDFFPTQACGRSWQWCQLGVHNFSRQLISIICLIIHLQGLREAFLLFIDDFFISSP